MRHKILTVFTYLAPFIVMASAFISGFLLDRYGYPEGAWLWPFAIIAVFGSLHIAVNYWPNALRQL